MLTGRQTQKLESIVRLIDKAMSETHEILKEIPTEDKEKILFALRHMRIAVDSMDDAIITLTQWQPIPTPTP
jgi:hypothetical protein